MLEIVEGIGDYNVIMDSLQVATMGHDFKANDVEHAHADTRCPGADWVANTTQIAEETMVGDAT